MKTAEELAKRAAYMREYTAKNRDRVNEQRVDRHIAIKESEPEEYKRRRSLADARNSRYRNSGGERVRQLEKENRVKNYSTERAAAKRNKHKFSYATKTSIKSARKRAEEYGLPFDLTEEWFDALFDLGCSATGLPMDKNGSKTPFTVNIDRIVPKDGYVTTNCRLVCSCFNKAKWNWADADVEKMARAYLAKLDA